MLPYSSSRGRHAAPPDATTDSGCVPMNELHTSMLCRCCSTIWSPQIHTNEYQPRCWNSISLHLGSRFLFGQELNCSTGVPSQYAYSAWMSPNSPLLSR